MRVQLLCLGLVGCPWWTPPSTTSTSGMAGVVHDAGGKPIQGLEVVNLESTTITDAEGGFGLYYKRPDLHVNFEVDGVWYRRVYREEDEGRRLVLDLPDTKPLDVDCSGLECELELRWDLGSGLSAKERMSCTADGHPSLAAAPVGEPTVKCTKGGKVLAERATYGDRRVVLQAPARPVTVDLDADAPSGRCTVQHGEMAYPIRDQLTIDVSGSTWLQATCDGRPAVPVPVGPGDTQVQLSWSDEGPTLVAPAGIELQKLQVQPVDGPWTLRTAASEAGSFKLPPLPAGKYRFQLFDGVPSPLPQELELQAPEGPTGQLTSTGTFVFGVELTQDLVDGVVEPLMKETP